MQLKLLTYNIRHGLGIDGKVDLSRVLGVLQITAADIIGLNEVDKYQKRSGFQNQARWLAKKLKMYYRFAPAYGRFVGQMGNAILSRYPILTSRITRLTSIGEQRVALEAHIGLEKTYLTCICTHLGLSSKERMAQVQELEELINQAEKPLVLMGDFNASPTNPEITVLSRTLKDAMEGQEKPTFPASNPKERIDYVFISDNCAIINADAIESEASDHLPVVAAVEVK